MGTSFVRRARFIGDERRLVNINVSSTGFATAIQPGDLVFSKSPTTDAGTIISFVDLGDSGTKAQNQAAAVLGFVGVAQSRGGTAGQSTQVATGGVFSFACTSGTYTFGQLVGPEGTGVAAAVGVSPTTLVGVTDAAHAIGRVVIGGTTVTTIQVELKSVVAGGTVPDTDIVATTLTLSGALVAATLESTGNTLVDGGLTVSGTITFPDSTVLVASGAELNRVATRSARIVNCTASTLAVTEALHDKKIITLNRAAGIAVTLPVAAAGLDFTFVIGTTFTAAATIKSVAGADIMVGHATMGNDSDNTTVDWQALSANTFDTIDLFGTAHSTGGYEGQIIRIIGLATNKWFVEIQGDAAGTEATPFQDTVA